MGTRKLSGKLDEILGGGGPCTELAFHLRMGVVILLAASFYGNCYICWMGYLARVQTSPQGVQN